ncbi:MAG: excinuclease [Solibacillus sp.]|uniref:excinuclease n=1 Tax=unclassified Solibacillus TaxID=2637870 RepID=UPI0030F5A2A1
MKTRYKITRLDAQGNPTLSLEECQSFFAAQPDFEYNDSFGASQDGVHMKIKGHFFMWQVENAQIPFRFFDGEIYVSVSHLVILEKTMDIARQLNAVYIEG